MRTLRITKSYREYVKENAKEYAVKLLNKISKDNVVIHPARKRNCGDDTITLNCGVHVDEDNVLMSIVVSNPAFKSAEPLVTRIGSIISEIENGEIIFSYVSNKITTSIRYYPDRFEFSNDVVDFKEFNDDAFLLLDRIRTILSLMYKNNPDMILLR